jgi:hypothetical protein
MPPEQRDEAAKGGLQICKVLERAQAKDKERERSRQPLDQSGEEFESDRTPDGPDGCCSVSQIVTEEVPKSQVPIPQREHANFVEKIRQAEANGDKAATTALMAELQQRLRKNSGPGGQ